MMPELSTEQMAIVQHGYPAARDVVYTTTPEGLSLVTPSGIRIDVPIVDGGVHTAPESLSPRYCDPDDLILDTLAGYCEIYRATQYTYDPHAQSGSPMHVGTCIPTWCTPLCWYFVRHTSGGGMWSTGHPSRAHAELDLARSVWQHVLTWEAKLAWRANGDMTVIPRYRRRSGDTPNRVIRCGGHHYTIGPEPSPEQYRRMDRSLLGFSGARFRFRLLASGEVIESHNVWYQGQIPTEYRAALPNNAEKVTS